MNRLEDSYTLKRFISVLL